jgi:hypothetical protein
MPRIGAGLESWLCGCALSQFTEHVRQHTAPVRMKRSPGYEHLSVSAVRIWPASLLAFLAIAVAGCSRDDEYRHSAAREAGKFAYKIEQDTREAAKKADRKLREASREARQGWNEAKRETHSKEKK